MIGGLVIFEVILCVFEIDYEVDVIYVWGMIEISLFGMFGFLLLYLMDVDIDI